MAWGGQLCLFGIKPPFLGASFGRHQARRQCRLVDFSRFSTSGFDVIFVHAAHGDDMPHSMFDVAQLYNSRSKKKRPCLLMGDFNVDMLPSLCVDQFQGEPGRNEKHLDLRLHMEALVSGCGMEFHMPSAVYGNPPSEWLVQCSLAPITRAPRGMQHGLPSTLDYCASIGHSCGLD